MYLIGVNDSYLFFINDSEHLNGKVSFYNWSMEYVKTIGQSDDPYLPFYFKISTRHSSGILCIHKLENRFGRYYFMDEETGLKIIDEKTGILLISIENPFNLLDFVIDNDFNIILFCSKSFKYLSYNFELLKKIEWGQRGFFFFG